MLTGRLRQTRRLAHPARALTRTPACSDILSKPCQRRHHSLIGQHVTLLRRHWQWSRPDASRTRSLLTEALPTVLIPPVIFLGLLVSLWTYKCFMTIVFQDKIIYMPYMPPFARSDKIANYSTSCQPVVWQEQRIRSLDGTRISLCIGTLPAQSDKETVFEKEIVLCYFQGNGSSLPPRLPFLSQVLKLAQAQLPPTVRLSLVALSYRGYWSSAGRASQSGIELDAQAMLNWISSEYPDSAQIILWGQSIGAGVAATAASTYLTKPNESNLHIAGLILETPFTSVKSMLLALYPQRWLPYRYLFPFLWNHWDSELALRGIAKHPNPPRILLMPATRDEVVPAEEIEKLEKLCRDLGLAYERKNVVGALHTEASTRREGQEAVARYLVRLCEGV